jgi:hypothetical protein
MYIYIYRHVYIYACSVYVVYIYANDPLLFIGDALPEPYRNDGTYDILRSDTGEYLYVFTCIYSNILTLCAAGERVVMADWNNHRAMRKGSLSLNVHELVDEGEEDIMVLREYFNEVVLPLSELPQSSASAGDASGDEVSVHSEEEFVGRARR